jgi:hypothetical protein
MTNHPRRSMKVEVLHDTLQSPDRAGRAWFWKSRVSLGERVFMVTQKSMTGAFEGDTARHLVEAYLDGTLRSQAVEEITG